MKIILVAGSLLFLISCKTNIVDHYDCQGKEELLSKTFTQCVEASHQKECDKTERSSTIQLNPIMACEKSSRQLICTPVYKEVNLK